MFQDAFTKLEKREVETVLDDINRVVAGKPFSSDAVTILAQDLSFYPGFRFFDMTGHGASPAVRRFVVHRPGEAVALDWTNDPLYVLNAKAPIRLTERNIVSYVRFFFNYVRGRHGRFIIVENVDEIPWREDPPGAVRKAVGQLLLPVTIVAADKKDGFNLTARMLFRDSLFKTDIHVRPDGMVSLAGEELLLEDMPVLDDVFGQ